MIDENDELDMRDKYQTAVSLLDAAIMIICEAYNLEPVGPPHDIAGWILVEYFEEFSDKEPDI